MSASENAAKHLLEMAEEEGRRATFASWPVRQQSLAKEHALRDAARLHQDNERLSWLFEGCARVLARRDGYNPLDYISDAGHQVWQLHGFELARAEMKRDSDGAAILPQAPGGEGL